MRFISFLIIKWYGFSGHMLDFFTGIEHVFGDVVPAGRANKFKTSGHLNRLTLTQLCRFHVKMSLNKPILCNPCCISTLRKLKMGTSGCSQKKMKNQTLNA